MEYLEIIKRKAFRQIKDADITLSPFSFCIQFEDGVKICNKDEVGLRIFLCTIQNVKFEIISDNTEHCIPSPVGYFALLGFRSGDKIQFSDDKEHVMAISFY